ncbi:MAG TPA: DEAD/DEAH box helicase [Candidatus Aminicenantes bacterium]|nr:DEAD/DEAH box helicase [Candidatus Aminicenantes bacterium]
MKARIEEGVVFLSFPFDSSLVEIVGKAGLGMKWKAARKEWTHPLTCNFKHSLLNLFPELKKELPATPNPGYDWEPSAYLMAHQEAAARKATHRHRYGIFHDTGVGKTLTAIEIIKQKKVKALVVCPLSIIETAWMEDIKKFAPEIKAINLWEYKQTKSKRKKELLRKQLDSSIVCIANFETFRGMEKEIKNMGFEMLIIDESSFCKDPKTATTKKLTVFADRVPYVYLLSGTPAPNSPLEYFPQIRMLDQGLLGANYYSFRKKYAYRDMFETFKWVIRSDKFEELLDKLASVSEVVKKEDTLDLPGRTYNEREVVLTSEEMTAYQQMKDDLLIEFGETKVIAVSAAVKLGKLRQGGSGFYYDKEKVPITVGTSKLKELLRLLEEIGDHQVIIWTQFQHEARQVEAALSSNIVKVDGTVSQKQKIENINLFKSGKAQYIVAHPASLGIGQNLTNCSYAAYYSLSHSYEKQGQSEDRIYRKGQVNHCSYYFLLAKGTVDRSILKALHKKQNAAETILNYIKEGV